MIKAPPKPPRVADHYEFWVDPPPAESERLKYWLKTIEAGWRPNRRIRQMCYDCSAEFYGVWLWEYLNVLAPMLQEVKMRDWFIEQQRKGEIIRLAAENPSGLPQHYGVKGMVWGQREAIDLG
jgi:hypothetical protein